MPLSKCVQFQTNFQGVMSLTSCQCNINYDMYRQNVIFSFNKPPLLYRSRYQADGRDIKHSILIITIKMFQYLHNYSLELTANSSTVPLTVSQLYLRRSSLLFRYLQELPNLGAWGLRVCSLSAGPRGRAPKGNLGIASLIDQGFLTAVPTPNLTPKNTTPLPNFKSSYLVL